MGQLVTVIDDLTGATANETVLFGLDGKNYEIDLTSENAAKLRGTLATFVDAGRTTIPRGGAAPKVVRVKRQNNPEIREWAARNGFSIAERGRLPERVISAFEQAH